MQHSSSGPRSVHAHVGALSGNNLTDLATDHSDRTAVVRRELDDLIWGCESALAFSSRWCLHMATSFVKLPSPCRAPRGYEGRFS